MADLAAGGRATRRVAENRASMAATKSAEAHEPVQLNLDAVRVSVIIPVKAINDYIRENLRHLAHQTCQDFEVLILPDHDAGERFPNATIVPTWPLTGPADKRDLG